MISSKNNNINVHSTIDGDKIAMSIDAAATAHIMSVLTDLYSDPELAVIREYRTNAYDAHVEAGNPAPIEVTTPTDLSPFLRIRDYGVGLDSDGIANIYSKYGASTKRDTNDQVGMLGLGCKSALTYTSQFTLVGIKDGIKTVVSISREDDGAGSMTVVEATPTDEPNGVEVVVPAKSNNQIESKARDFFRFWTPGTVLLNGAAPEQITGLSVTDDILVVPTDDYSATDYVVMGNVAYPADLGIFEGYYARSAYIVAYVGIGEVAFTPSRESLYSCPQTDATIESIKQQYEDNIEAAVGRTIDEADTFPEAFRIAAEWRQILRRDKIQATFQGHEIPLSVEAPDGHRFIVANADNSGRKQSKHDTMRAISPGPILSGLFVYDYHVNFTANHKKKLVKYCDDNEISVNHFVLCAIKPDAPWIPSDRIVHYDEIKAVKLPRTYSSTSSRTAGTYDAYEITADGVKSVYPTADEISGKLVYLNTTEYGKDDDYALACALNKCGWKGTFVLLAQNRVEKFTRDFPKAKPITDILRKRYDAMVKSVPSSDYRIAAVQRSLSGWEAKALKGSLDLSKLDDPAFREVADLLSQEPSAAWEKLHEVFTQTIRGYISAHAINSSATVDNPFDKYPLWSPGWGDTEQEIAHFYLYANAVYAASQADEGQASVEADA